MKQITEKDIKSFGVVLEALAQKIQTNPELILNVLQAANNQPAKVEIKDEIYYEKVTNFILFEMARKHNEAELTEELNKFTVDELKYMIKHYHLGPCKKKVKKTIIPFIVEQAKKRAVDIFRKHD